MKVIPAIDIYEGKVVRLTKGDFDKRMEYLGTPLDYAIIYEDAGFNKIHIVDLAASVTGALNIVKTIEIIKSKTKLNLQVGGGIKNLAVAELLINCGVDFLIIGSISITNKEELNKILKKIPSDKIIIAADFEDEKIAIKGWQELSNITIEEHINYCQNLNLKSILCTDISKDGMLKGPSIEVYKKLLNKFPNINLIASGGITTVQDLEELKNIGIKEAVVGKAIYENKIKIEELKRFA